MDIKGEVPVTTKCSRILHFSLKLKTC